MSIRYDWLISFFFDYRWQQQNRFEFSMFHCSTACVSFFFFSLTAWLLSSSSTCGWLDWALGLTMCWTTTNDGWNVLSIRSSNKFLLCYFSFWLHNCGDGSPFLFKQFGFQMLFYYSPYIFFWFSYVNNTIDSPSLFDCLMGGIFFFFWLS